MSSRIPKIDVPEEERRAIFAYLKRQDPGSKKCFDCSNKAPTWASIHFGIYVCIDCSGRHRSMGTHITFVQSTDIDQWTVENLRYMKLGGNTNAANVLGSGDVGMRKYLDDRGNLLPLPANYKEKLRSLVDKDRSLYPDRVYIEALAEQQKTAATATEEDELDWLDSQIAGTSKPKTEAKPAAQPRPTITSSPAAATLPGIGRTISSSSTASKVTTSSAVLGSGASSPSASRTTSTSTLGAVKKTSTLGATKTGSKLGAKKGLGATKAGASGAGGFEEAAKRAQEEAEKKEKEEKERQAKELEEKLRLEEERKRAEEARKAAGIATPPSGINSTSSANKNTRDRQSSVGGDAEMERLGMGVRKMGFGAVGGGASAAAPSKKKPVEDDVKVARERFGNQKAISSDMYFERNEYDPDAVSAAQTRLQDFRGATSISSNQYFGRSEEDEGQGTSYGGGSGYLSGDGLSGLESAARDTITKVLNNPDVQNLQEGLRSAGLKLSDYLATFGNER